MLAWSEFGTFRSGDLLEPLLVLVRDRFFKLVVSRVTSSLGVDSKFDSLLICVPLSIIFPVSNSFWFF